MGVGRGGGRDICPSDALLYPFLFMDRVNMFMISSPLLSLCRLFTLNVFLTEFPHVLACNLGFFSRLMKLTPEIDSGYTVAAEIFNRRHQVTVCCLSCV